MLGRNKLVAYIGTRNPVAAREFYRDTLGLPLVAEDGVALVFDAGGTMLRVNYVQEVAVAEYTILGWAVPDIVAAADGLRNAGVTFERFQGMLQNDIGVWESPSGALVAWFKDPDGNLLNITQFPHHR